MMPSAKHGDPQLGIDIHLCTTPVPAPLPTPHFSIVFDPFDYIPIIGATVSVMGMKRATAGTAAIVVHIPPGFPFAPLLPDKEDEVFMGSSTVLADGDPLSYLALPVLGCQVAGMPSPPRPKKKRIKLPNLLPTTFNLAIPANVNVGGAPTISMAGMVAQGAFAGLGKLAKSKFAKNLGDRFKKFRQKTFKNMDPGFLKCKVLRAEPVNILTGEVVVEQVDFTLAGRIPIEWVRSYSSNSSRLGTCGYGWESPADARLEIDGEDGSVMFRHPGEGVALFANLPSAQGDEAAVLELMDGALLTDHGDEFQVRTKSDLVYQFRKVHSEDKSNGLLELPLTSIKDLCGNWLQFDRADGRLRAIRESCGRQINVLHADGRIAGLSLFVPATGFSRTFVGYEYDEIGNLTRVLDPLGEPCCFAYEQHHMVRHTDRSGLSFYYGYDRSAEQLGREWQVVRAWGDGGLYDYQFVYWPATRETRITDSLGHVFVVQCDERGLPILEVDPLGGRTFFEYDDAGRTTAVVNPANHRTEYVYDERGNLLQLSRPDGSSIRIEFDTRNKPTRVTYAGGATWEQSWDSRGLLLRQRSPLGALTCYEYNEMGLPISLTNARKARTCFSFDVNGYLVAVTDALGNVTRLQRDELGNVLAQIDPLARATAYRYDAKSRLVEAALPLGGKIRCAYDARDLLTEYVDENGVQTRFDYVGQGQLRRRREANGHTVEYHYDTEEQLVGVSNQRGETYRLCRDALGRVVEEVDYWGQSTTYQFDAAGYLRQSRDPLGRVIQYQSDRLGRVRSKRFADPEDPSLNIEESFDFDLDGNMVGCANRHIEVRRRFDDEGRLIEEKQGSYVVKSSFDEVGNRIKRETSAGNTVSYQFDLLDRVAAIQIDDHQPVRIERNEVGQVVKECLSPTLTRHYQYDGEGRLAGQGVRAGERRLFATRFEYDHVGNITLRSDTQYGTDRYRYDALGHLCEHIDPQGRLSGFFSDPAGDRLSTRVVERREGVVAGGGERLLEWSRCGRHRGIDYEFDRAGNLSSRTCFASEPSSPPVSDIELQWDANQRLVSTRNKGIETRYGYDPIGRRVFKQTVGGVPTHFYWDGDALLAEEENGRVREYVYFPEEFVPLAMVGEGGDASHLFYYHTDPNGCPARLTDPEGRTVWAASIDAWGRATQLHVNQVRNPIRLQGQYFDPETDLHYNRHRYYDPSLEQFISQDPLGLEAGVNVYRFAPNVGSWVDPYGLTCQARLRGRTVEVNRPVPGTGRNSWQTLVSIPPGAHRRTLHPVPGGATRGVEYRWNDGTQTWRVRIHDADPSAPVGSNAHGGWVVRVQRGKQYTDDMGNFHPPGIHNPASPHYNPTAVNDTHIPCRPRQRFPR
ncbi:polymorphic toxin type 30 domain-containing protein [Aquabacterium sp. A7-Y]|uniref:polymorphic toxin type 30 domain-containing protein n=1 Tax=Aquabacterium sp. A7-Y TaxID=1349605 RepID=UPI00223CBF9C|nr:polymorphic toxin type 30 domain-containing protein [Aquabacterium sp. A7-Y]MCW7541292.1 polymorphic toxin type 30 domain-containing protein [Aquabacterium sp. A7-Y]